MLLPCRYITYLFPESAVKALAATDGTIFQGRLLHVLPARPQVKVVHNGKRAVLHLSCGDVT